MTAKQFDEIRRLLICIFWAGGIIAFEIAFWLWADVDWEKLLK